MCYMVIQVTYYLSAENIDSTVKVPTTLKKNRHFISRYFSTRTNEV